VSGGQLTKHEFIIVNLIALLCLFLIFYFIVFVRFNLQSKAPNNSELKPAASSRFIKNLVTFVIGVLFLMRILALASILFVTNQLDPKNAVESRVK
jgi:uncharacterized membrane protein YhaH (DUF805 family)